MARKKIIPKIEKESLIPKNLGFHLLIATILIYSMAGIGYALLGYGLTTLGRGIQAASAS